MEIVEGSNGKRSLEGGCVPPEKKQWKSPSQVQILESAYTVSPKPSAEMKEELARVTGLDYKQVQYWFGNRRFLDRHGPRKYSKPKSSDDEKYITYPGDWQSSEYSKDDYGYMDSERHCMYPQPLSVVAPPEMQSAMLPTLTPSAATHGMKPWSHFSEMPREIMPWELQSIVSNIERKLGHPLIADGPIVGVEFKPLPPAAFGSPLERTPKAKNRASSRASDGKAARRVNNQPQEEVVFSPNSGAHSVSYSSREEILVGQGAHEFHHGVLPLGVPKYQFLPAERNSSENCDVVSAHINLSSANTTVPSVPSEVQGLSQYACATSTFTSKSQPANPTINHHKENHNIASSNLTDKQRSTNSFLSDFPPDVQYDNNPVSDSRNSLALLNMEVCEDSSVDMTGKSQMLSTRSTYKNKTEDRDCSIPEMVDSNEERNKLDFGIGKATNNSATGERVNGVSLVTHGVTYKDLDQDMQKHEIEDMLQRLGRLRGYGRFIVKPRERYQNRFGVTDKTEMNYFSDIGCGKEPIVAKWNEKERRADYGVYISDGVLSDSSGSWGTDSTHSDEYDYEAAANLGDYVQSKLKVVEVDRQESVTSQNHNE